MTISVRAVRYESESEQLVEVLQTNLPYLPHARLFQWQYHRNPAGQALTWVATDPENQRIIGVAAAFPRRFFCCGEEALGYVLGDFCVDANHRSLGLALALQKACLEGISAHGAAFAFDFPSRSMVAIYTRLRLEVRDALVRYAKPLRADRKIAARIPVGVVARGLSAMANASLRLRDRGVRYDDGCDITPEAGIWGEEFTQAARAWSLGTGLCVARTADYLNWRYRQYPGRQYEMLAARHHDRLRGYVIYSFDGESCTIADLLAEEDGVRQALLLETIAVARRHHIHTLSAPSLSTHPSTRLLEKCGFRPRESSPVVLLEFPRPARRAVGEGNKAWYLTAGDWEG